MNSSLKAYRQRNPETVRQRKAARYIKDIARTQALAASGLLSIPEIKVCPSCRISKPRAEFGFRIDRIGGLQPRCKSCARAYAKQWRDALPKEKAAARRRVANLKTNYGMSVEAYEALLSSQGRSCAICRAASAGNGRRFAVDHDHGTGAVRGLLCGKCNAGLGQFRDDAELLQDAISYLHRARGVS